MLRQLTMGLLCFLSFSGVALSQTDSLYRGGGGGFFFGLGQFETDALQVFLPDEFPELSDQFYMFGGGGYGFVGNIMYGAYGQGVIGEEVTTDSLSARVSGGMGFLQVGYMLLKGERYRVFPMLGIGGGGTQLEITKNGVLTPQGIADNPGNETTVETGGLLFDISASFEFNLIQERQENGRRGGLGLGITAGYMFGLESNEWSYSGGDVNQGPDFALKGLYVKLTLGGFGWSDPEDYGD